jgi:hypothetical protein
VYENKMENGNKVKVENEMIDKNEVKDVWRQSR